MFNIHIKVTFQKLYHLHLVGYTTFTPYLYTTLTLWDNRGQGHFPRDHDPPTGEARDHNGCTALMFAVANGNEATGKGDEGLPGVCYIGFVLLVIFYVLTIVNNHYCKPPFGSMFYFFPSIVTSKSKLFFGGEINQTQCTCMVILRAWLFGFLQNS